MRQPKPNRRESKPAGSEVRILLVDDNEHDLYLLQVLLEHSGFHVVPAVNGAVALEEARRSPPDLAIADILMPVMDGFSLCREWHQDKELQKIPFVFYTATYTDPKDEELALNLGAVRFIRKPQEPAAFVEILKETIAKAQSGELAARKVPFAEEPQYLKEYNARLIEKIEDKMVQLARANRRLSALYRGTEAVCFQSAEELVPAVLQCAMTAMELPNARYFAYDAERGELRLLAAVGFPDDLVETFRQRLVFHLGEERGLVGLVAQARQPLIVNDTHADPRWIALTGVTRSALLVPVAHRDRLYGVLDILSPQRGAFDEADAVNAMTLARHMATALENSQLVEQVRASEARYRLLAENATDMIWTRDLDLRLTYVSPAVARIRWFTAEEALAQTLDEILTPGSVDVARQAFREEMSLEQSGKADPTRVRTLLLEQTRKDGSAVWTETSMTFLRNDAGRATGILGVTRDTSERMRAEQSVRDALVRTDRALRDVVNVAGKVAELRDPYTAGHQRRVAELAGAIARELGLPEDRIEGLRVAGLLHDIGKASVPAEILSRPTTLSKIEFDLIKAHPEVGHEVLQGVDFPWPVAEIVREHHERLDGSGYPQGLKDGQIRVEAKILAVADVVEAMSSHRPYRPAHPLDKALAEIRDHRGELYDPQAVDACLKLFSQEGFRFTNEEGLGTMRANRTGGPAA